MSTKYNHMNRNSLPRVHNNTFNSSETNFMCTSVPYKLKAVVECYLSTGKLDPAIFKPFTILDDSVICV